MPLRYSRRKTRSVSLGSLYMGSEHPILVQSMNNIDTKAIDKLLVQIHELAEASCDITRVAVPDQTTVEALAQLIPKSPIPIIADIHYDYKLALGAIEAGCCKIRINPGNIRSKEGLTEVAKLAKKKGVAIRVGVNAGSISPVHRRLYGGVNAEALIASGLEAVAIMEAQDFRNLVISVKTSDPLMMIEAYRGIAEACDYPLHLGVTEAGTLKEGIIRSSVGIGALLSEGIGDTIRVSLTADPVEEVHAGIAILKALGHRKGPELVSCPGCGRTQVALEPIALAVEEQLRGKDWPIKLAVMGCPVNGPGEAKDADLGIAGSKDSFILFAKGKRLRSVSQDEAVSVLMALAEEQMKERESQKPS